MKFSTKNLDALIKTLPDDSLAKGEYDLLCRQARHNDETLKMLETVAAAGARVTALAGGGKPVCGGVQFSSKEGVFSEEIAFQRIKSLLNR